MATIDARFIDYTTEDERVFSVRVSAPVKRGQLEHYLSRAYPYPSYFRLDREPTLPLTFPACTVREG
jgi:hypothetical protein